MKSVEKHESIGYLFPAGGPVPADLIIGREEPIEELARRIEEGMHTMLTGPRRIGKTTVCDAVCRRLQEAGSIIVKIEVPEGADAEALLQLIIDRCREDSASVGRVARTLRPLVEAILEELGLPLDLSQLAPTAPPETVRKILSLPLKLAERGEAPVVFYCDELQRVVDYEGGERLLGDLVDIYSGKTDAVMLVDGSSERALERMMVPEVGFGKLVDRLPLAAEIPARIWRQSLPSRFERARLTIEATPMAELIEFGAGRAYPTMMAARCAALNARKLGSEAVGIFEVEEGIAEARRHLEEDRV